MKTVRETVRVVLPLVLLVGLSACSSVKRPYRRPPPISVTLESVDQVGVIRDTAESPGEVLRAALQHSRPLHARHRDVARAEARVVAAGGIRSPELRFGFQHGEADGSGSSTHTAYDTGGSSQSSREDTWNELFSGPSWHSTQTGTEQNQDSGESQRIRTDWDHVEDKGWGIGLRLFPPNPWQYHADVSGAEARLRAEEARLLEEQIDVMRGAAMLVLDMIYYRDCLDHLNQLESVVAVEEKRAGQATLSEQTDLLRRTLAQRTRAARLERQLDDCAGDLERMTGRVVDPKTFEADWAWLPGAGPGMEDWDILLRDVTGRRADLACAYWQACEIEAEYHALRAGSIPWFRYVEVGYARSDRDASGGYTGDTTATGSGSGAGSSSTTYFDGTRRSSTESSSETSWSQENERNDSESSRDDEEWSIQAAVEIPIFDWMRGGYKRLRKAAQRAWDDVEASHRMAEDDIRARVRDIRKADEELMRYQHELLPQAWELRSHMEKLVAHGRLSPADRIRMEEQLMDVQCDYLAVRRERMEALVRLWAACGAPRGDALALLPASEKTAR